MKEELTFTIRRVDDGKRPKPPMWWLLLRIAIAVLLFLAAMVAGGTIVIHL